MADYDSAIRGAREHPFIGISEGKFAGFEPGSAREEIDAAGLVILPGVIDSHVHFNEPGRADWEGFATGSRACAAGGITTFVDMPLNAHPPTLDPESFHLKRAAAERSAVVDFGLWGGLVPTNLDQLEALHECGVIGLKAFMAPSGIDDFQHVDLRTLRRGMQIAAGLRLPVAVHAEMDHPELRRGASVRDWLASRPISIELEAIAAAIELAGETGCALHIVHVSSAEGARLVMDARRRGVDVTCETCPHYLLLTEDDVERLGGLAKCAPPLRGEDERLSLVSVVRSGGVTTIGSDHSPAPSSMKTGPDFYQVWGGISGCQHLLVALLELEFSAASISDLTSVHVAQRFGIGGRKGGIRIGADADLVLVDLDGGTRVTEESLQYRHRHSPYVGRQFQSRVVRTIVRGRTVFSNGDIDENSRGKFIAP
jgi:allantoinase